MTEELLEAGERFNLRDGQRPITFVGWKLAEADSQSGSDVRWTELTLYKTLTGKYVLEKVGRSDVFHSDSCTRRSKGVKHDDLLDAVPDEFADDDTPLEDIFVPCDQDNGNGPHCHPSYDESPVWVEKDISAVTVVESADKLVDSLFRKDNDNMRFLSRVSRALLEQAALADEDVKRVMSLPSDVT